MTGLWFSAAYDRRRKVDVRLFYSEGPIIGRIEATDDGKGYVWNFRTKLGRKMEPGIGKRTEWKDMTGIVIDNFHDQVRPFSPAPASRIFRVGDSYTEKFPAPAKRYRDVSQYGLDLGVLVMEYGSDGWNGTVYVSSNGSPLGGRLKSAVGTVGGDGDAFDNAAAKLHAAWQDELSHSEPD